MKRASAIWLLFPASLVLMASAASVIWFSEPRPHGAVRFQDVRQTLLLGLLVCGIPGVLFAFLVKILGDHIPRLNGLAVKAGCMLGWAFLSGAAVGGQFWLFAAVATCLSVGIVFWPSENAVSLGPARTAATIALVLAFLLRGLQHALSIMG